MLDSAPDLQGDVLLDRTPASGQLRVLIGHRPPAPATRYVDQIVGEQQCSSVDFQFFGGMLKRFDVDVVHLVEPIRALGPRRTADQRLAKAIELVQTLADRQIAIVQTVLPGEPGVPDESRAVIDRATSVFVALDELTVTPDPERTVVIPHAHYRDRFLGFPRSDQLPGRLLSVSRSGLARAAQGPLKVFSVTHTPGISLRVVGDGDPALGDLVARAVRRSPDTVAARFAHLSDAELVTEITEAELVLLAAPESLDDFSTLFIALSLDRPVVVPSTPSTRLLAEQVGPGWVHCLAGPLTAELLDDAIAEVRRAPRRSRPDLDGRDPATVAARYEGVYRSAARQIRLRAPHAVVG